MSDCTTQLGCIAHVTCRFGQALSMFIRSVDVKRSMQSVPTNGICLLLSNVGNACTCLDRLQEGYQYYEEASELRQAHITSVPDPDNFKDQPGSCYGGLSGFIRKMGKLEKAWEYANYSTKLCRQVFGKDNAILATQVLPLHTSEPVLTRLNPNAISL